MVTEEKYLKKCFAQPPITAYRRQKNLRNFLMKSKIAPTPQLHPQREMKGMKNFARHAQPAPSFGQEKMSK